MYNMVIVVTCLIRSWECSRVIEHVHLLKAKSFTKLDFNSKPPLLTVMEKGKGC